MAETLELTCEFCGTVFQRFTREIRKRRAKGYTKDFCSVYCLNQSKKKTNKVCPTCGTVIGRNSSHCRIHTRVTRTNRIVEDWLSGNFSGTTKSGELSVSVRNYLLTITNHNCSLCGWGEVNPTTGLAPLEIHHIDGDSLNNVRDNLQVLCPNCHSLTSTFRKLNKKSSRKR